MIRLKRLVILLLICCCFLYGKNKKIEKERKKLDKKLAYIAKSIKRRTGGRSTALNKFFRKKTGKEEVVEIEQAVMQRIIDQGVDLSRCEEFDSMAEVDNSSICQSAESLQVKYMIFGLVRKKGKKFYVSLSMVRIKNNRVSKVFSRKFSFKAGNVGYLKKILGNDTVPALNKNIIAFVRRNIGNKVGDGSCWAFVAAALQDAGGRRKEDYVWGIEIPWYRARPGDIIQFSGLYSPKHSAIVNEWPKGFKFRIAHQNGPPNGKRGGIYQISFAGWKPGLATVYRPTE